MVLSVKIPQHKRLYEILRRHIVEGTYGEGDLLPSENELCRLHGVTRPTVRQALGNLANDGYISRHQGKGSIVHYRLREIGILSVAGTTSAVGDRNLKTRMIIKTVIVPWGDEFKFPRITSRKFENRSLFRILREYYQIEIKGGEQRIKAIPASLKISRYLQLRAGEPVLHLERKMETSNPGLFLYSSIFCNTKKYSIFGRF